MSRHLSTCNISSKSMHAFLSNLANRQTDRQTDKRTRANAFTSSFVGDDETASVYEQLILLNYPFLSASKMTKTQNSDYKYRIAGRLKMLLVSYFKQEICSVERGYLSSCQNFEKNCFPMQNFTATELWPIYDFQYGGRLSSWIFAPNMWNITVLWLFYCPVVVILCSRDRAQVAPWTDFNRLWLKWRFLTQGCAFWGSDDDPQF